MERPGIIIGIHGLANKPPVDEKTRWWKAAIAEGLERNEGLAAAEFAFEFVNCADLRYETPLAFDAGDEPYRLYEGSGPLLGGDDAPMLTGHDVLGIVYEGIDRITGTPTLQLAQAIPGAEGRPAGIVLASIDLTYLAEHKKRAGLPPDATLIVADRNGTILVRLPDHAEWVGKRLPAEFWSAVAANRGRVIDLPGLRGNLRITAIAAATPDDLDSVTVAVGLLPATAFADIDAATQRGVILIVLGALLAIVGALLAERIFIRKPVRSLLKAASAWRTGDLGARSGISGPGKFRQLGEAFDAMATSLQRHEGELRADISRSHLLQERQTMMLHELNHRVRNTLTTVRSLARQSRRTDETGERLEGRIISLSKTHDLLSRDDWAGASLRTVLENELAPFRDGRPDRFHLAGPDLDLPPRYVLALGMTLHELTTNAAKYGALSVAMAASAFSGASSRARAVCTGSRWNGARTGARRSRNRANEGTAHG